MIKRLPKLTLVSLLFLGTSFITQNIKAQEISKQLNQNVGVEEQNLKDDINNRVWDTIEYKNIYVSSDLYCLDTLTSKSPITFYSSKNNKNIVDVAILDGLSGECYKKDLKPGENFVCDLNYNRPHANYKIYVFTYGPSGMCDFSVKYNAI